MFRKTQTKIKLYSDEKTHFPFFNAFRHFHKLQARQPGQFKNRRRCKIPKTFRRISFRVPAWKPGLSAYLGFHEYDGKVPDFSKQSLENELTRLKKYDKTFNEFDTTALSKKMFYDFRLLIRDKE